MNKTYYSDINNLEFRDENDQPLRNQEDDYTFAIREDYNGRTKFKVRLNSIGEFYNPADGVGTGFNRNNSKQRLLKKSGQSGNDYAEVTQEAFDLYLMFLKNYKEIYLKQAKKLRG